MPLHLSRISFKIGDRERNLEGRKYQMNLRKNPYRNFAPCRRRNLTSKTILFTPENGTVNFALEKTVPTVVFNFLDTSANSLIFEEIISQNDIYITCGITVLAPDGFSVEHYFINIYNYAKGWLRCVKCNRKMEQVGPEENRDLAIMRHQCPNLVTDFQNRGRIVIIPDFNKSFSPIRQDCLIEHNQTQICVFFDFECNRNQDPIGVSLFFADQDFKPIDSFGVIPCLLADLNKRFAISKQAYFMGTDWFSGPMGFFFTEGSEFTIFIFNPENPKMNVLRFLFDIFFPNISSQIQVKVSAFRNNVSYQQRVVTTDKVEVVMISHNGGRYDNLFFIVPCLNWFELAMSHLRSITILINNGSIISFEVPLLRCQFFKATIQINVIFRDSLKYVPSNAKSLDGVATELKIPMHKSLMHIENIFVYCEVLEECLGHRRLFGASETSDFQEAVVFVSEHCPRLYLDQQCYKFLDRLGERVFNDDGSFKNCAPQIIDGSQQEVVSVKMNNFHLSVASYCKQDTTLLFAIMKKAFCEILLPKIALKVDSASQFFNLPTLSSIFYRNMFFDKINHSVQGTSNFVDQFCRKALYGGRVCSSIIGQSRGTFENCTTEKEDKETRKHIISLAEAFIESRFHRNVELDVSETDIVDNFNRSKQTFCSFWEMFPLNLKAALEKTYVHLDICSQYPTAMTAPMPSGELSPLSQEQSSFLQGVFSRPYKQITQQMNAFGYILGIFCVELRQRSTYRQNDHCSGHLPLLLPNLPRRLPDGRLQWVANSQRPIHGYYSTYDLIQARRDGWSVKFIRSIPERYGDEPHIFDTETRAFFYEEDEKLSVTGVHYGVVWESSQPILADYMKKAYQMKKEGKEKQNPGLYTMGKVIMNGGYGSTLFDKTKKGQISFKEGSPDNLKQWKLMKCQLAIINEDKGIYAVSYPPTYNALAPANRPSWIGVNILSCSRIMLWQLREALRPTSPILYVDTDSMTISSRDCLSIQRSSLIKEGDEIGSFEAKTCQFAFNINYETTGSGSCCEWWSKKTNGLVQKMPCILSTVIVLARKLYAEKCLFCEKTRVRAKGFRKEALNFNFLSKIIEFQRYFSPEKARRVDTSERILTNSRSFLTYYLPQCFKEDSNTNYFREHADNNIHNCHCQKALQNQHAIQTSSEPWTFFGFVDCPLDYDLACTIRIDSLKVHHLSKTSNEFPFRSLPTILARRCCIRQDTINMSSIPCSACGCNLSKLT